MTSASKCCQLTPEAGAVRFQGVNRQPPSPSTWRHLFSEHSAQRNCGRRLYRNVASPSQRAGSSAANPGPRKVPGRDHAGDALDRARNLRRIIEAFDHPMQRGDRHGKVLRRSPAEDHNVLQLLQLFTRNGLSAQTVWASRQEPEGLGLRPSHRAPTARWRNPPV